MEIKEDMVNIQSTLNKRKDNKQKKSVWHRIIILLLTATIIIVLGVGYYLYSIIYKPNINLDQSETEYIYIPSSATYTQVLDTLKSNNILYNLSSFQWVAEKKNYPRHIYGGRYLLRSGMNNNEIVNMLRSGKQDPVSFTFNNIKDINEIAGLASQDLEADSSRIVQLCESKAFLKTLGLTPKEVSLLFLDDTYQFNWNTQAPEFLKRMNNEREKFWDNSRIEKAKKLNFTPFQVAILASIVQKESNIPSEKPVIAGVYLNRLRKNWPLQADPTIVYANKDKIINRVLNIHLRVDSPYNTYIHTGLPPGPICIPSKESIDAVLNADKHNYMYFCASPDLSGKHVFSRTLQQHNRNARAYKRALNKMKIFK
ncbi:MAG: endolytic transglycosylase MltG [Hyphomicrobiales bacterium]